jgi:hypothetical protein
VPGLAIYVQCRKLFDSINGNAMTALFHANLICERPVKLLKLKMARSG